MSAIVEAAQLRGADLIVMSTHGRSGLGRLILGSVAEAVLRSTTTPILLVRASEGAAGGDPRCRPRYRPTPVYKRAIVPSTARRSREAILPFLRQIAGPLDMEVLLLRVVAPKAMAPIEEPPRVRILELETQ